MKRYRFVKSYTYNPELTYSDHYIFTDGSRFIQIGRSAETKKWETDYVIATNLDGSRPRHLANKMVIAKCSATFAGSNDATVKQLRG